VLEDLRRFVSGESNSVAGIPLSTPSIIASLRLFTLQFLEALRLIEKVQGRTFSFADCSLMNCLYAGAFLVFNRNLEEATKAFDRLFRLRGIVLPTSNDNLYLVALRENGEMLYSEAEIVELRSNVRIERVFLLDHRLDRTRVEHLTTADKRAYLAQHHCPVSVSSGVTLALKQADIIIYSAGTQHSSLYPTYMASGLASTIADNRSALKVFVTNIGADYETPSYKASDYLHGAYRYLTLSSARHRALGELVDRVLVNQSYRKANETYVIYDEDGFSGLPVQITIGDYESLEAPGRHDGNKLIDAILAHYEKASIAESRC